MNYATITKQDMLNGDGIRAVFWVTGCSHHCKGCHNPETWDYNIERNIMSVEEILNIFDSDSILH